MLGELSTIYRARKTANGFAEDRKSRAGLARRRGLILQSIMSGLFFRSWH